jgi:hypothetical protein
MAYIRVFRRVRLAPGVTLNLSKSGPSLSLGIKGAHVTVGKAGIRRTVGLPGTGVFYTARDGWHSGAHSAPAFHNALPKLAGWRLVAQTVFLILLVLFVLAIAAAIFATIAGQ